MSAVSPFTGEAVLRKRCMRYIVHNQETSEKFYSHSNSINEPKREKKKESHEGNLHEIPSRMANPHSLVAQVSPPSPGPTRAAARDQAMLREDDQKYKPPLQEPRATRPKQKRHPKTQSRALPVPCSGRRTAQVCRVYERAESKAEKQLPRSLP
jgi:hypothetical protein